MAPSVDLSFLRSRARQKRIAAVTVAFAVLGVAYVLLAPRWYRSVLTVVPARQQKAGISSMLAGDLGGLAAGLDVGGGSADATRISAVLQSIAVSDAVIEKLRLRERYRQEYQETTRSALWAHCNVKTLTKANLVELSCEDTDPRFAQQMLASFAEYGNDVFRRVNVSSATEEVRFLEKRVAELREQANATATRMREFQEKYQIVDLDTQSRAVVSALAALNTQRITKQLELDFARTFSSRDEATTRQLESELEVMERQLRDMERSRGAAAGTSEGTGAAKGPAPRARGMFPAALEVPKLRAEFEQLYRDRKVAEATLVFALERLENAKANEARDVSTFQVLDPPTLPTRHARPKRLTTVALLAMLGLGLSIAFEYWRSGGGAVVLGALGLTGPGRESEPRH